MRFAQPEILMWLWAVVGLTGFLWRALRRRKNILRRVAEEPLAAEIRLGHQPSRIWWKQVLVILVFFFGIMALARPQWGFEWQEVKRQGVDIFIAVDTSKSMLTQDVRPNRLERTKLAVKDLLKKTQGDRVGLVAFAGEAFLVCPLTSDHNGFLLSLEDLDVETIPRGGTNIASAIQEILTGYEKVPNQYKAMIIVTDGENQEGDPLKWARQAKEKGIKIYCVGIGTQEGELIQVPTAEGKEFLKDDQGNFVKSRLNENLLQEIALATGGIYVRASGAQFGLDLIYDKEISKMEKREIENKMEKKYYERFQFPLGLALLFLILETCLPARTKKRK